MQPLEVPDCDWICRFIAPNEWNDELQEPIPTAFLASDRQLSVFHHRQSVESIGDTLRNLCIESLSGYGEAHLQVSMCISLGQGISDQFNSRVFWQPDKVLKPWEKWRDAHAQIESLAGNTSFPRRYRVLLARNAVCPRFPDSVSYS